MKRLLLVVCVLATTACSSLPQVQPWQKGNLAKPEMAFDSDPLDARFMDHTYLQQGRRVRWSRGGRRRLRLQLRLK